MADEPAAEVQPRSRRTALHDTDTGSPEVQIALLDRSHQPPHRAPEGPQEGPSQPSRPADAGRSPTPPARLRPRERRRALPGDHRPTRSAPLNDHRPLGPTGRAPDGPPVSAHPARRRQSPVALSLEASNAHAREAANWRTGSPRTASRPSRGRQTTRSGGQARSTTWRLTHTVSGGFTGAPDKIISFETGKLAGHADGAVVVRIGRHHRARHRHRGEARPRGHRLLPADRRHRGAHVRRGQDPRLVLPP